VKGTPYKWLDLEKFFSLLRPADDILQIRYFTALISGPTRPNQETFLAALATLPRVEGILGRFKTKQIKCRYAQCASPPQPARFFQQEEEKRTEVNIAIHMLDDAYRNRCDQFVLVSGDSDLAPLVTMIRDRLPSKRILVYVPAQVPERGWAVELRTAAHKSRILPLNLLPRCQFPTKIADGSGRYSHQASQLVVAGSSAELSRILLTPIRWAPAFFL
jgi:hypothetical protein